MIENQIDRKIGLMAMSADGANGGGNADGNTDDGEPKGAAEDKSKDGRTYSREEFLEVVKARDEAKRILREKKEADEKAERDRLEKNGEFEKINSALKADLEKTSAVAKKAEEYEASISKMLKAEAEGLGTLADAIITNSGMSFDARFEAVKDLKAKLEGSNGSGTSAGSSGSSRSAKKDLTPEEVSKLSAVDKAKYFREQLTK
jgi:hypothetical protein